MPNEAWSAGVFYQMMSALRQVLEQGPNSPIFGYAFAIMRALAIIEVVVCMGMLLLRDESNAVISDAFIMGIKIGVVMQLVRMIPQISTWWSDSWVEMGLTLSGHSITLQQFQDPGSIMLAGWQLVTPIIRFVDTVGMWGALKNTVPILFNFVAVLVGWMAFLIFGGLTMLAWIEVWIVTAFAVPSMAFAVLGFTESIGRGMLTVVLSAGMRLGVLAMVVGAVIPVLGRLQITDTGGNVGYDTGFALAGAALVMTWMAFSISKICAMMMLNSIAMSADMYRGASIAVRTVTAGVSSGFSAVKSSMVA